MSEIDPECIIRRFESGATILRCSFCSGNAVWPASDLEDGSEAPSICPVCKGKAVVHIKADLRDINACSMCRNTGRRTEEMGRFFGNTCEVCRGTGYIDISESSFEVESTEKHFWSLIDSRVKAVAFDRFLNGFLSDAVESAFKEINFQLKKRVKEITHREYDGKKLAEHAFSVDNPVLIVEDITSESGKNIQIGYMMIFSGAVMGIRNPKAHENISITKEEAINHLFIANYLVSKLSNCKVNMDYRKPSNQ